MTHRFSLAHLTALGCAPPEATYIAALAGYDYISLRLILLGLPGEPNYALAENPTMLRQTKSALAETGLKLHDIELAHIHDNIDPKSFAPAMEVAAELGARQMISSIWTQDRSFALDAFSSICDLAKPYGLTVNLEFVTWAGVTNLQQALEFCRDAGRDNCGILIDTLHFHRSGVKPAELDAVPRDWFHFVHLCDAPPEIPAEKDALIHTGRAERLYLGEGGIDLAGIVSRIPEVVYSLEIPHLARVRELGYAEHARRCLRAAKNYFATHFGAQREFAGRASGLQSLDPTS